MMHGLRAPGAECVVLTAGSRGAVREAAALLSVVEGDFLTPSVAQEQPERDAQLDAVQQRWFPCFGRRGSWRDGDEHAARRSGAA